MGGREGHLYLTGEAAREPVKGGRPWPAYFTGSTAAIAIMAALFDSGRTGDGQLVDIGTMETMAASHQWTITPYTHHGYVKRRDGNRPAPRHRYRETEPASGRPVRCAGARILDRLGRAADRPISGPT